MSISDRIRVKGERVLSAEHYTLKSATFDWRRGDGEWQTQKREIFERGTRRCCPTTWPGAASCWSASSDIRPTSTVTTIS